DDVVAGGRARQGEGQVGHDLLVAIMTAEFETPEFFLTPQHLPVRRPDLEVRGDERAVDSAFVHPADADRLRIDDQGLAGTELAVRARSEDAEPAGSLGNE